MTKLKILLIVTLLIIGISITGYSVLSSDESHSYETKMTVYKSPTCGCCAKWVDHINDNQIGSKTIETDNMSAIKNKYDIHGRHRSCHTGVVSTNSGEYIFEGHIPSEHIKTFLQNPPEGSIGLSVPGMPLGSPGMEVGEHKSYYQVLLLKKDGSSEIYAHVNQLEKMPGIK